MTDLFPFMRFGMFAETVKNIPPQELFSVHVLRTDGSIQALSERQIGLDDSHLNYLARTYFYNHQFAFFTNHLKKSGLLTEKENLMIIHKTRRGNNWKQDTLVVK